jgi:hypothetical protein
MISFPQLPMLIIENTPNQEQNNEWMDELEHDDQFSTTSNADDRECMSG